MSIRITDGYLSSILINDLNHSLNAMFKQQVMAGSMRRVNSYADDPRAVSTIQRYDALIAQNDAYIGNVTRSRILVDASDTALQSVSDILSGVRVIALRESSALATEESMNTSVVEVDNLINQLLDILNSSVEGTHIFAGSQTNVPPFVRNGDTVLYQGNDEEYSSRTGPSSTMTVNIPGDVFVGAQSASLAGTVDLAPRIQGTTLLTDLNMGAGWEPGAIQIEDGTGTRYQVDLTGAVTVGQVIAAVSTGTGGNVTMAVSPDGSSLQLSGTGPLTITENGAGTTAASLGINGTTTGSTFTGRDVRPVANAAVPLANIEALSGSLPLGSIEVEWQGATTVIDLSSATTLGDLNTLVAAAVPGMEVEIRDTGLVVLAGAPEPFIIRNADATNTASALGISGTGSPVRLFGVLADLKAALMAGDKTNVRNITGELESLEGMVYRLMMRVGGRQTDLDWAESLLRQRDERLQANLSLEQDVDVAAVASDLSRAETSYQASLMVTSRLYEMNLMDFLR
jgi:flagellar hook-associated protein 3 FlgL